MSTEIKKAQNEDLNKSIDSLLDEVFGETVSKGSPLDLAADNKTTADAAVSQAPKMEKDEARGAGRPKQISDVPQVDQDGKRGSEYDAGIAEDHGATEPEEAKKQAKAIDQVSKEGHMAGKEAAPKMAPFKKSDGEVLSDEEVKEFEEFRKSKAEAAAKAKEAEELKKAEKVKSDQEALVKSAVAAATASLRKENEELKKSFAETNALIKAMAAQPQRSKSITGIDALEKSERPEDKGPQTFSKSEILDAAMELAMKKSISDSIVSEIEMTGRCSDPSARAKIEKYLEGK